MQTLGLSGFSRALGVGLAVYSLSISASFTALPHLVRIVACPYEKQ